MIGFNDVLGTGQVEDRKMMKDKLIDGKNCEQVQVNLMIIQFRPKLDNFYCIGVMN